LSSSAASAKPLTGEAVHQGNADFEEFGIQHELDKALRAKSGSSPGYIVTTPKRSCHRRQHAIRRKGSTRLENIVKTISNVKEIAANCLRLRIIVVDS